MICGTEYEAQMITAPAVNQKSPAAIAHFRPILSERAPELMAPNKAPNEIAEDTHSFSLSLNKCPRSSLMDTREAEMTPVSYPKQKPDTAAAKDKNAT